MGLIESIVVNPSIPENIIGCAELIEHKVSTNNFGN
jgi:hypothetical protein